ncbi:MAG: hypothetical protein ACREP2_09540 [Rhodanobacteraceae bacterium]
MELVQELAALQRLSLKQSSEVSVGKMRREPTKMTMTATQGRPCRAIMSLHENGANVFAIQ